jgi:hypothetical protein
MQHEDRDPGPQSARLALAVAQDAKRVRAPGIAELSGIAGIVAATFPLLSSYQTSGNRSKHFAAQSLMLIDVHATEISHLALATQHEAHQMRAASSGTLSQISKAG